MRRTAVRKHSSRVFGFLLLPSLLVAPMSVMLLDSPKSGFAGIAMGYVVLSTFSYPFYVLAGRMLSRKVHELNGSVAEVTFCALIPLFSGLPWLAVLALFGLLASLLPG